MPLPERQMYFCAPRPLSTVPQRLDTADPSLRGRLQSSLLWCVSILPLVLFTSFAFPDFDEDAVAVEEAIAAEEARRAGTRTHDEQDDDDAHYEREDDDDPDEQEDGDERDEQEDGEDFASQSEDEEPTIKRACV